MIKAVILDFYGVLYSNFNWDAIDERIKPDKAKAKRFEELKNQSNRGEITNLHLQKAVADLAEDILHPEKPAVYAKPFFNFELIRFLDALPIKLKIAVLSNGNRRDVERELNKNGVIKRLDAVITSSDTPHQKPQREVYELMLAKLGVKAPEAVIIDDSQRYIDVLCSYGFKAIHYLEKIDFEAEFNKFLND